MRFLPGVDSDKFYLGLLIIKLKQLIGSLDRRDTGLAKGSISAVVEKDVGRAATALVSLDAADSSLQDFVCADSRPISGHDIPLDRGKAEFAGGVEHDGSTGSVRRAEVTHRHTERVLKQSVAAG